MEIDLVKQDDEARNRKGLVWTFYENYTKWLQIAMIKSIEGLAGSPLEHRTNIGDLFRGQGRAPGISQFDVRKGMHFPIGDVYYHLRRLKLDALKDYDGGAFGALEFCGPCDEAAPLGSELPRVTHPGLITALCDNFMGLTINTYAFTVSLDLDFLHDVPSDVALLVDVTRVSEGTARNGSTKIVMGSRIMEPKKAGTAERGKILVESRSMFIRPNVPLDSVATEGYWKSEDPFNVERALLERTKRIDSMRDPDTGALKCRFPDTESARVKLEAQIAQFFGVK